MKRLSLYLLSLLLCSPALLSAQRAALTVQQIMQDPDTWVGAQPSQPFWSEDGQTLYFRWNPQGAFADDSLFSVPKAGGDPVQVPAEDRLNLPPTFNGWHHGEHVYDQGFNRKVYARDGDLYLYNRTNGALTQLTETRDRESNPRFTPDGKHVVFQRDGNLYQKTLQTGSVKQLTDLRQSNEPSEKKPDEQDRFLKEQQEVLFEFIRTQKAEQEAQEEARERDRKAQSPPPTYYFGKKSLQQLKLDPTGRFVTFTLNESPPSKSTLVQNYVTESGYAEDLNARAKVGAPGGTSALYIQDLQRDTTFQVDLHQVPGAYDVVPFHLHTEEAVDSSKTKRTLYAYGPFWNSNGTHAIVEIRTRDNKDRWITRLDPETGDLHILDRQTDEAWLAGPGISWFGGGSTMGWLPDDRHFYFQSEATGYSHLYTVDAETGEINQLTEGDFEVTGPQLNREGTAWTFASSEATPHERHAYRMPLDGEAVPN